MLKILLTASVVTLITAMSGPSATMQAWPTAADVEEPPVEYQGAPSQPFAVVIGTPYEVHQTCSALAGPPAPGYVLLACTVMPERVIVFPHCQPGQEEYCGKLWRHEVAHLNGWRH